MNITCPQCTKILNESTNRLIQDNCGHKKCRICLLQEESGCRICKEIHSTSPDNNLVIKCNKSVIQFDTKLTTNTDLKEIDIKSANEIVDNEINLLIKDHSFGKSHSKIPHIIIISKSPLLYKCTICLKSFSTKASIKYHGYCDGAEKPLKCDKCNKGFISRSHLETHRLKHSGLRPFSCSKCQKTFTQKSKLNRHMKLHTGDRPFVCSECGKDFTNKDALKGHLRLHSGEQPYNCKQCSARFNNKSNLTKHIATHTKEKLFMCEECGKKFGNKWVLVAHRKSHNNERPYICQKCSKSFAKIKDLKRHNSSHLEVKPFSCKLCHIRFCRKNNLERHLKNTHSIKDLNEIKSATTKTQANKKIVEAINNNETEKNVDTEVSNPIINNEENTKSFEEKPNAIHVIKMSNKLSPPLTPNPADIIPTIRNAVPVINGPFKLAFKTDAFKNNYNILNREYIADPPPRIHTKKPYDMVESLNICQKILSPMNVPTLRSDGNVDSPPINTITKNVIMSVGKVNEKESLEICKKILTPDSPPLHYETSFEHRKHAVIKNIKFKLPSTYTNNALKTTNFVDKECNKLNSNESNCKKYTELQPVKFNYQEHNSPNCKQSVIVNNISSEQSQKDIPLHELIHWRKRTAQNLHSLVKDI